jgi:hypothetical protein
MVSVFLIVLMNKLVAQSLWLTASLSDQKSVLASVQMDLASRKKEESDALKVVQSELIEAQKQVTNLTNQLIGEKKTERGHQNEMELNEQCKVMNVVSHAAKLGTTAQTKAEMLAQSQLQKAQQFQMYSSNIGMREMGMGSGGMQVPHRMLNTMIGNTNGMMPNHYSNQWGMMNGMGGGNGVFNPFQGMAHHHHHQQQQPFMMMNGMMPNVMAGGMRNGMMPNAMMPNAMAGGMQNGMMTNAMAGMQHGMMSNAMAGGMQNGMVTNDGTMPPVMQTGGVRNTTTSQNQAIMSSPDASNQNQALAPPTEVNASNQD